MQDLIDRMKEERNKIIQQYRDLKEQYYKLDDAIKCLEGPASTSAEKPPKKEQKTSSRGLAKAVYNILNSRPNQMHTTDSIVGLLKTHIGGKSFPNVTRTQVGSALSYVYNKATHKYRREINRNGKRGMEYKYMKLEKDEV